MKNRWDQYVYRLMTDQEQGVWACLCKTGLLFLSVVYRLLLLVRAWVYALKIFPVYRASARVISVGNLTMGGAGKTPLVIFLSRECQKRKLSPAVVLRGYMADGTSDSDEARMLRELLPHVPVLAGSDRVSSVKQAEKQGGCDVFLLDDGFQHWQVARDLDIVVVDSAAGFGNHLLLPRGILREPVSALSRADIIVLSRADMGRDRLRALSETCRQINPRALVVEAVHAPCGLAALGSGERKDLSVLREDIGMLCAIGSPDNFRHSLEQLGARVRGEWVFRDHHAYRQEDVLNLVRECRSLGIRKIVTTHKDAVKLRELGDVWGGVDVFILDVEMRITHGEDEFLARVDRLFCS